MKLSDIAPEALRAFNDEGHWYTSYPSLNHWTEDFRSEDYAVELASFHDPLHLYLHIPFCKKLCYYCICNVVISNDRSKIEHFLGYLLKEIDLLKAYAPNIRDIHFGGGTPSHLDRSQFSRLCRKLNEITDMGYLHEVAMEIDPRTVTVEDLTHYASHCVNRISFGIQDFDPVVQKGINREQPPEMIDRLLEKRHLFKAVNFDLLYGLPNQTMETIRKTLKHVLRMRPDRITLLKYCHVPDVRRHMKLIDASKMPDQSLLPYMFVEIADTLMAAGYKWVGLDHFALPSDPLSKRVGRTFNGFSSATTEMIGLGPTTTSVFGGIYAQAEYELPAYYRAIDDNRFPIFRGYKMTVDDVMRREVIFDLLCQQSTDLTWRHWYFEPEIRRLKEMPEWVTFDGWTVNVTEVGRLFLRNICKVFDSKDVKPEHNRIAQKSMTMRATA